MSLSAVVADDEALGRRGIIARLARVQEFEVVAECRSGRETIDAVRRHRPDLLFLDVQMPGIDGFQVMDALTEAERPYVIFVTAYDRHAVRAFEVQALDYIVKPIDDERFGEALRRASEAIMRKRESELGRRVASVVAAAGDVSNASDRREAREGPLGASFAVRDRGRVTFVRHAEVDWIESAGDYVRLHSGQNSWLMRETLSSVARRLPEKKFLRIHRRAIVHVDRIRELRAFDSGDYAVFLRDGTELRLSRTFQGAVARLTTRR